MINKKKLDSIIKDIESSDSFNNLFREVLFDDLLLIMKSNSISDSEIDHYLEKISDKLNEKYECNISLYKEDNDKQIKPFDFTKIMIQTRQITVDGLLKRIIAEEIDLQPSFQRNHNLWTTQQKSRLIESLILGIPIQMLYFDATNDDLWIVIDGLQRLTTMKEFFIEHNLILEGMEYYETLNGKNSRNIPQSISRRLYERELQISVITGDTPENVKYNVFKRINTGGVPLTPQEIRHSMAGKKTLEIIKEITNSYMFNQIIGSNINSNRMENEEYVLRFFSYSLIGVENYRNYDKIDDFLIEGMKKIEDSSDYTLRLIQKKLIVSLERISIIFGNFSFRKVHNRYNSNRKNPLNINLYDTLSYNFSKIEESVFNNIQNNYSQFMDDYTRLYEDRKFTFSLNTANSSAAEYRFRMIERLLRRYYD